MLKSDYMQKQQNPKPTEYFPSKGKVITSLKTIRICREMKRRTYINVRVEMTIFQHLCCMNALFKLLKPSNSRQTINSCIFVTVCQNPKGFTFQTEPRLYIESGHYSSLPMTSANPEDECKAACVNDDVTVCRMATLNALIGSCMLYQDTLLNIIPAMYMYDPNYSTFVRDCLNM